MDQEWHKRYDRAISDLIRDTMGIVEASFSDEVQRDAVKRQIKRALYFNMDSLKEDFIEVFGLPVKQRDE